MLQFPVITMAIINKVHIIAIQAYLAISMASLICVYNQTSVIIAIYTYIIIRNGDIIVAISYM